MKLKRFFIPILTLFFLVIIPYLQTTTESQARSVLEKHLEQRYGEPFYVGRMGIRSTDKKSWYEADIIPMKYIGTEKENDKYYWSTGTVRINRKWWGKKLGTGGDIYMVVRLNESAAEFYKPKLDELFGDKYLPVFDIDAWIIENNGDFEETYNYNMYKEGYLFITGHIYIFGRISNDAERDAYKSKIYSFIDHMKATKTYEYVRLGFIIIDERVLTKEFQENDMLKKQLVKLGEEYRDINRDYFRIERRKLMSVLSETTNFTISMEQINKGMPQISYYNTLLNMIIYSEKFLESRYIDKNQFVKKDEMYLEMYLDIH